MRKLLVPVLFLALVAGSGVANDQEPTQEEKEPAKKKPAPWLRLGNPAPALKVDKWLQGKEVRQFEPGKVYVVEFWATWCAPCIYFMPDMAELQARYRDRGVTIIAFTARDLLGTPGNTEESVAAFVKRRGPKLKYAFAYADDRTTFDAWMKAAGREGIPCAFVVDRTGRIAYIGSPMYLGVVLPEVLAGNMTAQAIGDEMGKIEQELNAVAAALFPDHKAGLKALADFEAKYPPLVDSVYSVRVKLSVLPKLGEVEEAKKVAESLVAKAIRQDNHALLTQVAAILRNGPGKESKELMAVAVKAAEAAVRVAGDKDASALIHLAETYFAAGDMAKARQTARMSLEASAAEPAASRSRIEQRARVIEEKKEEKK